MGKPHLDPQKKIYLYTIYTPVSKSIKFDAVVCFRRWVSRQTRENVYVRVKARSFRIQSTL